MQDSMLTQCYYEPPPQPYKIPEYGISVHAPNNYYSKLIFSVRYN